MNRLWQIPLSLLFWSYLALSCVVLWAIAVVVLLVTLPFDRERRVLHLFSCLWAYHYVWLCPLWSARFEGRERVDSRRPSVLVANHQSLGDILVLFGLFRHFKWVSKASIFKVPFIGWNMRMNDYVRLLRGDPDSIAKMMDACRKHLRRSSSVMMFPEGTRSLDGQMKPFKHGAFTLAKEMGIDVVPIVIDGTFDALPKHGVVFRQTAVVRIRVRVLEPVPASAADSPAELGELVRARMSDQLASMRGGAAAYSAAS